MAWVKVEDNNDSHIEDKCVNDDAFNENEMDIDTTVANFPHPLGCDEINVNYFLRRILWIG